MAQGDILYRGASSWTRLPAGTSGHYLQTQGAAANPAWAAGGAGPTGPTGPAGSGSVYWHPPVGLRLSLTTNTYVTPTDVTGAATVYWTSVLSGGTGLVTGYNGSALATKTVQQKSLALGTITSGANYNVYYDYDGDALALGAVWTNDTTPSETFADESGAVVLSSDHTKLYLGVIRTTATTTTEDSAAKRFTWNAYNRVERHMVNATETTDNWTYSTATWRQANANTANQLAYVVGQNDMQVRAHVQGFVFSTTANSALSVGIGVNSTTVNSAQSFAGYANATMYPLVSADYVGMPGVGYNYLSWLENGSTGGNFKGDDGTPTKSQSAITGSGWS